MQTIEQDEEEQERPGLLSVVFFQMPTLSYYELVEYIFKYLNLINESLCLFLKFLN
jgi:hypothetical protein